MEVNNISMKTWIWSTAEQILAEFLKNKLLILKMLFYFKPLVLNGLISYDAHFFQKGPCINVYNSFKRFICETFLSIHFA